MFRFTSEFDKLFEACEKLQIKFRSFKSFTRKRTSLTFRKMRVADQYGRTGDWFCYLTVHYHSERMYRMNTVIRTHLNRLQCRIHRRRRSFVAHLSLQTCVMILTCKSLTKFRWETNKFGSFVVECWMKFKKNFTQITTYWP